MKGVDLSGMVFHGGWLLIMTSGVLLKAQSVCSRSLSEKSSSGYHSSPGQWEGAGA